MDNRTDLSFLVKSFFAGGIAGMTSKTTVAPFDRIKILLQAHNTHYKHYGVFTGLRGIIDKESILGLYRGNGAQMVRVFPYAAVQFLTFEISKNHLPTGLAGSVAGVIAALTTYPLDLVRARLSFYVSFTTMHPAHNGTATISSPKKLGIYQTFIGVLRNEGGVLALYKGLTPTVIAMVPYAGLSFYCFEKLKHICLQHFPNRFGVKKNDKIVLAVYSKLLCGGFAGAIAQTVSYPLDVARRRMQLSMLVPETEKYGKNVVKTLTLTYKEHGLVNGLYRGMSINYIRAIPMVAVSFATYEIMKQLLGLDTGIRTKS